MRGRRVVVVPPAPALLPQYASAVDPVAELRTACRAAVSWLGAPVRVLADDDLGRRVGESLLGRPSADEGSDLLVLANGSARRSERAPGHLDSRSFDFDDALGACLARGDATALGALDQERGRDLLASGLGALRRLAAAGPQVEQATVDYADDPFGVQYWVVRWQCAP